jgi:hypothetical protein
MSIKTESFSDVVFVSCSSFQICFQKNNLRQLVSGKTKWFFKEGKLSRIEVNDDRIVQFRSDSHFSIFVYESEVKYHVKNARKKELKFLRDSIQYDFPDDKFWKKTILNSLR